MKHTKQANVEAAVADAVLEKAKWIRFGLLPVRVRPVTLAQIIDLAEVVAEVQEVALTDEKIALTYLLKDIKSLKACQKVVPYIVFRNSITRVLLGWYVKKHLTMARYEKVMKHAFDTFNAGFFLTSITILKGLKTISAPTRTQTAIAHGASSEG